MPPFGDFPHHVIIDSAEKRTIVIIKSLDAGQRLKQDSIQGHVAPDTG